MYIVYMLSCENGSLYTGITTDMARRLGEHTSGKKKGGGNYTRTKKVLGVVYAEEQPDRSHALKREAAIKRLPRAQKLALIANRRTAG